VLTRTHRLTSSEAFTQAVRRGRRAGTTCLVLHLAAPETDVAQVPVRIGFVVSKAVGPSVTRNLVKRRLRHLARERLSSLPGAAAASYATLAGDFDVALGRLGAGCST
jgi:ribonuclease P protein component